MSRTTPEGFETVTASLTLKDCAKAIETYKKAFGATVVTKLNWPETDKIMHAVLQIGNSKIMLADEFPGCPAQGAGSFFVYFPDVDAAMKKAKDAGLKETMPAEDMFWGDRMGNVKDENGISWNLATHVKDVSEADIQKGAEEFAKRMKDGAGKKAA